jgi:hypothetical protein
MSAGRGEKRIVSSFVLQRLNRRRALVGCVSLTHTHTRTHTHAHTHTRTHTKSVRVRSLSALLAHGLRGTVRTSLTRRLRVDVRAQEQQWIAIPKPQCVNPKYCRSWNLLESVPVGFGG